MKRIINIAKFGLIAVVAIGIGILCIPLNNLFDEPYSFVLEDDSGKLLSAQIASDEQWRFPGVDSTPNNFRMAVLCFEDKRFYQHFGVDFIAIGRAIEQNLRAKGIKSGASTITMQVARLSRSDKPRNISQKLIEIGIALKLELKFSKEEILNLWANHAPFGGNVVGIEAASWRYFNKSPQYLSLSESACLAVLPNAPSLIHPGKHRPQLLKKRNRLLKKMYAEGIIDQVDYELALLEEIPARPHALPRTAPHALQFAKKRISGNGRYRTTIKEELQFAVSNIASSHAKVNQQTGIENLAILVLDTYSGEVVAYIGNSPIKSEENDVDMIQAKRSSGSVLKPLLYARMMEKAMLLPKSLVLDIPTRIQGFHPENYDRKYTGAIPASDAISMSLNVPAVRNLQQYGVAPFLQDLKRLGFSSFNKSADHYGLSLILGGGEVSLWELCGSYASMGRTLIRYNSEESKYFEKDFVTPSLVSRPIELANSYYPNLLSAGAIYHCFEAMEQLKRPNEEGRWEKFSSSKRMAWKTGTSYGHKDAWAVGLNKRYTIGVWVGNADGEQVHGLVGVQKAAPILFDVLNVLPDHAYFDVPIDNLEVTKVCALSGNLASKSCEQVDSLNLFQIAKQGPVCENHKRIYINDQGEQVNSSCALVSEVTAVPWFILPPNAAFYYRKRHPTYKSLPKFKSDCDFQESDDTWISMVYPTPNSYVYLPTDGRGKMQQIVFEAKHRDNDSVLYWHLDNTYLGETIDFHSIAALPSPGKHTLLVMDQWGHKFSQNIHVLNGAEGTEGLKESL